MFKEILSGIIFVAVAIGAWTILNLALEAFGPVPFVFFIILSVGLLTLFSALSKDKNNK